MEYPIWQMNKENKRNKKLNSEEKPLHVSIESYFSFYSLSASLALMITSGSLGYSITKYIQHLLFLTPKIKVRMSYACMYVCSHISSHLVFAWIWSFTYFVVVRKYNIEIYKKQWEEIINYYYLCNIFCIWNDVDICWFPF